MKKTERVCIVIPAYNEAGVVGDVIISMQRAMKSAHILGDIVVVDDGSSDETSKVARKSGAIVIDHILNSGAGSATATGLSYANQKGYGVAATMDADGQHKPSDVINGIKIVKKDGTDLLIGSRLIDAAGMSTIKRIGNWGLSTITFVLFGVKSTDSQSGLRIFSRNALEKLRWKTSGYEFASEMLWRARQSNLVIDEYPVEAIYTDYSRGKGQNNWNAINILKSLVKRRFTEMFE